MVDVKINDLGAAGAVVDNMQFETDIGGTTANKVTAAQIKSYVNGSFALATDPATDAAVTTAIVDANVGTVITTTMSTNDQNLGTPTDTTSGRSFVVLNNDTSTDPINVNGQTIQVGDSLAFYWDGTAWVCDLENTYITEMLSTGIVDGVVVSGTLGTTTFDLSAGTVLVVDGYTIPSKPKLTVVNYAGATGIAVAAITSQPLTYVGINSNGAVVQQGTQFTREQSRDIATVAVLIHPQPGNVVIDFQEGRVPPMTQMSNQIADLAFALGPINMSGNVFSANGANLNIDKTAGEIFAYGLNRVNNAKDPSTVSTGLLTAASFTYTWRDGSGGYINATSPSVVPGSYDDGTGGAGTPNGSVSNNQWTIQRVYISPGNIVAIHYGQNVYASETAAIDAIETESFEINPQLNGALLRAFIIVKGNATALNDAAQAMFLQGSKFGGVGAGPSGGATFTLQGSYDVSTDPEIVTSTSGALTIREGNGVDANRVIEGQNNAGSTTFSVTGAGDMTAVNAIISGNLIVSGTTTTLDTTNTNVTDNILTVNAGESGAGVTAGSAGIEVDRGTATNYEFKFDESDDSFKIGQIGSLQKVATRQDTPTDNGVAHWDAASAQFVTGSTLTYDGSSLAVSGSVSATNGQFFGWGDNSTRIVGNSSTDVIEFLTSGGVQRAEVTSTSFNVTTSLAVTGAVSLPSAAVAPSGVGAYNDGGQRFTVRSGTSGFRVNNSANSVTNMDILDNGNVSISNGTLAATLSTASQPNITSVGTLTGLNVSGTMQLDFNGGNNYYYMESTNNYVGRNGTTGHLDIQVSAGQDIRLGAGGSEFVSVDSTGDIGIGDFTPEARLHVSRSGGSGRDFIVSNENANGEIARLRAKLTADTNYHVGDISILRESDGSGAMTFGTGTAGNASERLRIASTGVVGIGVTPNSAWNTGSIDVLEMRDRSAFVSDATNTIGNSNKITGMYHNMYYNGSSWLCKEAAGNAAVMCEDGFVTLNAGPGNVANGAVSISERFRVLATGTISTGGESSPDVSAGGICFQQGAEDGNAISLKSTDVTHGMTSIEEDDTYYTLKKMSGSGGGTRIRSLSELTVSTQVEGFSTSEDTSDTSSSDACINFLSGLKVGNTSGSLGDSGNIVAFKNDGNCRFLIKGNGNLHATNSTITALDTENDLELARTLQLATGGEGYKHRVSQSQFNKLVEVGALSSNGDFQVMQGMNAVTLGAISQLTNILGALGERLGISKEELLEMAQNYDNNLIEA